MGIRMIRTCCIHVWMGIRLIRTCCIHVWNSQRPNKVLPNKQHKGQKPQMTGFSPQSSLLIWDCDGVLRFVPNTSFAWILQLIRKYNLLTPNVFTLGKVSKDCSFLSFSCGSVTILGQKWSKARRCVHVNLTVRKAFRTVWNLSRVTGH